MGGIGGRISGNGLDGRHNYGTNDNGNSNLNAFQPADAPDAPGSNDSSHSSGRRGRTPQLPASGARGQGGSGGNRAGGPGGPGGYGGAPAGGAGNGGDRPPQNGPGNDMANNVNHGYGRNLPHNFGRGGAGDPGDDGSDPGEGGYTDASSEGSGSPVSSIGSRRSQDRCANLERASKKENLCIASQDEARKAISDENKDNLGLCESAIENVSLQTVYSVTC